MPAGFRVRVGADVRVHDGGRTLVGGSPLRVLRLREPAPALARGDVLEVADRTSGLVAERLLAANLAAPEPPPGPVGELTVVVPIRDRADRLDRLLAGLCQEGQGLPVVVVDDASRDPAAVASVAARHGARLVALSANVGPAGARNAGIAQVRTPYVAFVDSDVVVAADTLRGLARHFADPNVAAVGPRVRGMAVNGRPRRFERWDVDGLSLDLGATPALVRPWSRVGWLPSACLLVRLADLEDGAFEADRRVGEDVDLVWRLIRRGRQVRYDPAHVAEHDSRGTWSTWLGRKAFYGSGGAWLAQRHGDWMAPAVLSPVPALGALAVVWQRPWSIPGGLAALALVRLRLGRTLPDTPDRARLASALTAEVGVSTLRQGAHLLLRHWWPGTAAACLVSRRARRAVAAAMVWDLLDHRDVPVVRAPEAFVARRLDDLAYGAGLWWGALRAGSVRVLVPKVTGARRPRAPRPEA
ncbi:mycofactocin system glycosyltransferase [Nocardioides sp. MAH-18]|uniref:Mycofactocin system glycosyltransferase n=1 Tax=Nocardioides agri TaxID=2682843 RepID=A0A6L6XRP6_9ACTN|nr:mycofactocin biosynthesis glycosyltransferase MftF [Nocardioides sp. MAH-18]MBA2955220.1 mycofactocin biosynthesis glycosyltransferase MftF [Nocardioides sp. CGMCC 1.13656]MVQ50071.1 mycofactocin system glycosyltransferase [Nocardioides sp. MAH-18]